MYRLFNSLGLHTGKQELVSHKNQTNVRN